MHRYIWLFCCSLSYAEDMIDPNLISPIECPKPVVELKVKVEPTTVSKIGYQYKKDSYSLTTVNVNTYVLVELDGIMYRKYMMFSGNKWNDIFIKE